MSISSLPLEARSAWASLRISAYLELTKPRILLLVLLTVSVAAFVARWGQPDPFVLAHALLGTSLVAASASALNQWYERRTDALMTRTAARPIPSARLTSGQVARFAAVSIVAGVLYLGWTVSWQTAVLGLLTWVAYVGLYTPLKSRSAANTMVGAIAGALPILIGWSAAGGQLSPLRDTRGAALFLVLFLWQFPHFMAIAWIYRRQYHSAGLKMLTVVDPTGLRAGVQAVLAAAALIPISLLPVLPHPSLGAVCYWIAAFLLGTAQLWAALRFLWRRDESTARTLLRMSLIYLPLLWVALFLVPML